MRQERIELVESELGHPLDEGTSDGRSRPGWIPIEDTDELNPFIEALCELDETGVSIFDRVKAISQRELSIHDVDDLGIALPSEYIPLPRFRLNSALLAEFEILLPEVQHITDGIAMYLTKAMFTRSPIDPGGHLLRACYGSRDLNMLSVSFRELSRRLYRAADRVQRLRGMDAIYANGLSPVQTSSDWNEALEATRGQLSPVQVARVYMSHPRYQPFYPPSSRENLINWVDEPGRVGPSGPWPPLEKDRAASPSVLEAFPPRSPEEAPLKMYYPPGRSTPAYAIVARTSSYGKGSHWRLPAEEGGRAPSMNESQSRSEQPACSPEPARDEREVSRMLSDFGNESASTARPRGSRPPAIPRPSLTSGVLAAHMFPPGSSGKPFADSSSAPPASRTFGASGPDGGDGGSDSSKGGPPSPRAPPSRAPKISSAPSSRHQGPPNLPPWGWNPLLPAAAPGAPGGGGGGGGGGFPSTAAPAPSGGSPSKDSWAQMNTLRLDTKVSLKDLAKWDGTYHSAIDWVFDIQRVADMGEAVAANLGAFLPGTLESQSPAQRFYDSLSAEWKSFMRSSYLRFVWAMKEFYLTDRWILEMTRYTDRQHFRQRGHENENALAFLSRRLRYIRVLGLAEEGTAREITELLSTAPPAWKSILDMNSLTSILKTASYQHDQLEALAQVSGRNSSSISDSDLVRRLSHLGYIRQNGSSSGGRPHQARAGARLAISDGVSHGDGHAYITEVDGTPEVEDETSEEGGQDGVSAHDEVVREALAAAAKAYSGRGPSSKPKFAPRNDVKTSLGQKPPGPCRHCGSEMHWNRECPHRDVNEARLKASGNLVEHDDDLYNTAYAHCVNRAAMSAYDGVPQRSAYISLKDDDIERFVYSAQEWSEVLSPITNPTIVSAEVHVVSKDTNPRSAFSVSLQGAKGDVRKGSTKVKIVDEVDEDDLLPRKEEPSNGHLLEEILAPDEAESSPQFDDGPATDILEDPWISIAATAKAEELPAAPDDPKEDPDMIVLPSLRRHEAGRSAAGVSVLSTAGWLGSTAEALIDLRLDSCADVTLLSETFYQSMKVKPKLKRGMKLKLWQLTDSSAEIAGYVDVPVIMRGTDGRLLRMTAEAYVVPGMTVDVLLGEDFQLNYGISPMRAGSERPTLTFAGQQHVVNADPVGQSWDHRKVERSSFSTQSFVKTKTHRREHHARYRKRRSEGTDTNEVRATEDVTIPAESVKKVAIKAGFGADRSKEWLVEKSFVAGKSDDWLMVPATLLTANEAFLPVANPSKVERKVKKGDVLGTLHDPAHYFDSPQTPQDEERMREHATGVAAFINERMKTEATETHVAVDPDEREDGSAPRGPVAEPPTGVEDSNEPYGPKTAELPDNTTYRSDQLRDIIDVGDVPEELRERVWEMLERRAKAFGLDDRLGRHATKIRIRVKPEQTPIAVPMYTSSPEKRRVIEEQVRKWVELEVIEASRSPWSAPVVIAYRNGKARFCIDYRRLNSATIADEFPIPRQSDIMAALSGAQVLSTLDALSGFLQLEIHPDDVEKTAFRTHLGLFNFLRMPFGLRNGPAIFQRVMQEILAPFLWMFCLVYIDDIVVYSKTYEEHLGHLDQVLEAIGNSGITLSPKKCHLFYSSILLLGHKVSRLGLSTHHEKVQAILELKPPTKVAELQTFLGMVVYFSTFIPYYAGIARPLFHLLRKDCPWRWEAEEQYAFEAAKRALQSSPVLGHPIQGKPYRLYTDASNEALGCALQQVQRIKVADLKGTRAYDRLAKAWEAGESPPKLVIAISAKCDDTTEADVWGAALDDTWVHVERVIAYWSRTFKGPETRYSATEREALGAKEGLIKFQPFIEGEQVLLVTDHAALQWARTYENTNRRLANWGAVFSAYPGLQIVHRAGRVHSNVDPLSRLPRLPPDHVSPRKDEAPAIVLDASSVNDSPEFSAEKVSGVRVNALVSSARETMLGEDRPRRQTKAPQRTTFSIPGRDVPKRRRFPPAKRVPVVTERKADDSATHPDAPEEAEATRIPAPVPPGTAENKSDSPESPDSVPIPEWEYERPLPSLHVSMNEQEKREWVESYARDPILKSRWHDKDADAKTWRAGRRYIRDFDGLLYFRDADLIPRLCVPREKIPSVLAEAHNSAYDAAHAGAEALWRKLKTNFFWPRMIKDVEAYCETCDVCQKTKHRNFTRFGYLRPQDIAAAPFESISLDLIGPLAESDDEFTAILVIVDRLTKSALFVPTVMDLNAEGFAYLVFRHVFCKFGLPSTIYADRDGRWFSDFWTAISSYLKTRMVLSSARHPQHDGQTEIVNQRLEIMLRAYVAEDQSTWARWLPLLEHAYNSAIHSSTGYAPYQLLYGYTPKAPLDLANPRSRSMMLLRENRLDIHQFLSDIETHRDIARDAIAVAQEKQAHAYDARRRPLEFQKGELVLVNPHSLEWLESKGSSVKLRQRWIGPFPVIKRVSANTYKLKLPPSFPGNNVVNLQHLRPYLSSPSFFGKRTSLPDTRLHLQEGEQHDVEEIVAHRYDRKRRKIVYLVRFQGYSSLADKWLTPRALRDVSDLLRSYQVANNL
jgi:hypothetical protein